MTINARNKGKAGEQEVIQILQPVLTEIFAEFGFIAPTLRRNAQQYADGGEDIANMPWYACEIKRCERADLARWWLQAARQASISDVRIGTFERSRAFDGYVDPKRLVAWWDRDLRSAGIPLKASVRGTTPQLALNNFAKVGEVTGSGKGGKGPNEKKIPLLFWRQNRANWRVLLPLVCQTGGSGITAVVNMTIPCEISMDAFLAWWRFDLRGRIGAYLSILEGMKLRGLA